ncbi:DUF4435 domain-containing protein [Acinetobacter piscicola]|uniref:DUF4435 domain-containing protein n=1 Tax=Acinetobacter piscicola TaxID=2006115 RepID=UPI0010222713|nr:DUF4435 domain-containing protein [Acinetobacter piscicola]RYL25928.1 DUF4435 domain-containing protein [Acinetobacter piscicola]
MVEEVDINVNTEYQSSEDEDNQEKIQEYISLIEKTSLFTIFIEGKDDVLVYEPIEDLCEGLTPQTVDIQSVGGRKIALGIFDGLKGTNDLNKVVFIVDKDTWVHTGIPSEYNHERIICTTGYSIENDIFIDRKLIDLMKSVKVYHSFQSSLNEYLKWYVLAIERVMKDTVVEGDKLDVTAQEYFKQNKKAELILLRENEIFSNERFNEILQSYHLKLRGKNLFYLFDWSVNNRYEKLEEGTESTPPLTQSKKTKKKPTYNTKTILEETPRTLRGENLNRIFESTINIAKQGF